MSTSWYYVEDNERVGPVPEEDFVVLIKKKKIILDTYVWKKGFENWTLLKDVEDYRDLASLQDSRKLVDEKDDREDDESQEVEMNTYEEMTTDNNLSGENNVNFDSNEALLEQPEVISFDWENVDKKKRVFTIRIGKDRGIEPVEYGPFSIEMILSLIEQKRANNLTEIYTNGMSSYQVIGEIPFFSGSNESIPDQERRKHSRAPLVARLFFHDSERFFEGVCRDISIGGMQILVANLEGKPGDVVKLNVHPVDEELQFTAEAKVVRKLTECNGVSIRFLKMTPDNLEKINKYIELYED